jgi:hypothetical protein
MRRALVALAAATLAFPALAQQATPTEEAVSCEDYAAMTADDQMTAISDLEPQPGAEAADEHTASPETAEAVLAVCTENPGMGLDEAVEQAAAQ